MKVGFVQFYPIFGKVKKNLERMAELVRSVDADLLVFPELATSGYLFLDETELGSVAEPIPRGSSFKFLSDLAKETETALIVGMPEAVKGVYYNSAVSILPDGQFYIYRKAHLFDNEKRIFKPGDTGFYVFEYKGAKIGVIICYDWAFPEATRVLALLGAHIIAHPANLVLPYAQRVMRARSIENRVFTITANRIGAEDRGEMKLEFTGMSQVTDTKGNVILSAERDSESVKVVEIDPADAEDKKFTPLTDIFEDRRPELYNLLTKKF
ncbi:MAG: hypothetical protein DRQ10_08790 [Candidatus Hydrothermota bacterium]|nr:MAG: hypothetical protein DRQ10_08790 [Candidatus Hydrothermae bacterium]